MKIALSANGRSPHTERWANALASRGHELTVVWEVDQVSEAALAQYRSEVRHIARRPGGWPIRRVACPIEQAPAGSLAGRIRPDVVQGMDLTRHGWTAARFGGPVVQFALGSDVAWLAARGGAHSRYVRWRTRRALARADLLLCDSLSIARSLRTLVPGRRVEVIRLGVELSDDTRSARDWRSELELDEASFVVLSTRLLRPNYNIKTIIRAFAAAAEAIPGALLVLKDFESFGDPEYRERCRRLIDRLGVADRTRHVGEVNRPDLLALYRTADVFVSVPSNDSTAASVLEAMAASLPVVATRTDGLDPAVLRDGESALLVEPGDPSALAAALRRLHDSPALRERLADDGLATVAATGDLEREIEKAESLYQDVIRRRRGAGGG